MLKHVQMIEENVIKIRNSHVLNSCFMVVNKIFTSADALNNALNNALINSSAAC